MILEYREPHELVQVSYCFLGHITKPIGVPSYTKEEFQDQFQLKWVTLDEAIELFTKDSPDNYAGTFIRRRDLTFLLKARELLS